MVNHQLAPFPQGTMEIQALPAKKAIKAIKVKKALWALQEHRDPKEQKVSFQHKVIRLSRD